MLAVRTGSGAERSATGPGAAMSAAFAGTVGCLSPRFPVVDSVNCRPSLESLSPLNLALFRSPPLPGPVFAFFGPPGTDFFIFKLKESSGGARSEPYVCSTRIVLVKLSGSYRS